MSGKPASSRRSLLSPLAAALLALSVAPAAFTAQVPLNLHTQAARAYAKGGASGYASYAVVTFVVSRGITGMIEPNLGATVGDGTPLPALPPGFTIRNLHVEPDPIPDVCAPTPIYFRNQSGGAYSIYLAPGSDPDCSWTSGDYVVAVQFQRAVGNDVLSGSAVALLQVP